MEEQEKKTSEENYVYRWSYEAQTVYDREVQARQRRRGNKTYAIIMAAAFALCLAVLIGTVWINGRETPSVSLTTAEVSEIVNPGTVLIYAASATESGFGTGFFVRSDGYIVTNYHIVKNAKKITVTLYEGAELNAQTVWYSSVDDLAILKVEGRGYPTLIIGDSNTVKVGDTAIAVGNPAGNRCPWTTTQGIISAVNREVTVEGVQAIVDLNMMQTDAQVNPGNSGGPLCNDRGEVIGIITRKMTNYEGLGMAIPINGAMELVNAFLETGSTKNVESSLSKVRPTIGIQAASVKKNDPITEGVYAPTDCVLVVAVTVGGAADGILESGDLILEVNGIAISDMEKLKELLYTCSMGDEMEFKVIRMGQTLTLKVKLGTVD